MLGCPRGSAAGGGARGWEREGGRGRKWVGVGALLSSPPAVRSITLATPPLRMGYIRVGPPAPLPPRARLAAPPPAPVQAPPCQSRAGPHPCAAPLWALRWGRGEGKRVAGPSRGARSCPGLARRGPPLRAGARPLGPQRGPSPCARVPAHARMRVPAHALIYARSAALSCTGWVDRAGCGPD